MLGPVPSYAKIAILEHLRSDCRGPHWAGHSDLLPVILTLKQGDKDVSVALRQDTAEYLMGTETVDPKDWRIKDLVLACWAAARQLK